MATGTLTLNTSASVTLGTELYHLQKTSTVLNIANADKRRMTVPFAGEINVLEFGAARAQGKFLDIDFLLIVNQDTTNFVRLKFQKAGAETFHVKLLPGQQFLMWNKQIDADGAGAAFAAWADIDHIAAQADTGAVDIEYLIGELV